MRKRLLKATGPGERTGDSSIQVNGVSKHFNLRTEGASSLKERLTSGRRAKNEEFRALSDVTFDVPAGSMWALVGHNGSGKSTLLRCIAGIYQTTAGTIDVSGRMSALLELGSGFHPDLTGRENVYLNAAILGLTRAEVDARMDRIVDFAEIGEFIDAPVRVYSSGMYVRLGFAVAVNIDPEVLLIDEVIAVGDEEFQRKCFDYLHGLRKEGTSLIIVSHGLGSITDLCDEVVWLEAGHVVEIGPSRKVTKAYLDAVNSKEASRSPQAPSTVPDPGHARRGSGEIRTLALEMINAEFQSATMLLSGSPARLRVHYECTEAVAGAVVTLDFTSSANVDVLSLSNAAKPFDIAVGRGYLDFVTDQLLLAPGNYWVSASVTSDNSTIDAVDDAYEVVLRASDVEPSGVYLQAGSWTHLPLD